MILRYLAARLRFPGAGRYLRMGLGIERRARELAAFWMPHQERTRGAQRRWAEQARGDKLVVLGAGRLLDFDADALAPRFARMELVDGDRSCAGAWRGLARRVQVEARFGDVTGWLDDRVTQLRAFRGDWAATLAEIRRLSAEPAAPMAFRGDAVLSLNLLSQLPVGWQDGVEAVLWRRFGRHATEAKEQEWLDAVKPGGRRLVEQHLEALDRSGAAHVLLITDLDYVEYRGRRYRRRRWEPEPARYVDGAWQADAGVKCETWSALCDVNVEDAALRERWLPSYRLAWSETWLWHIAPMGAECAHCGTVHRVGAFALERATSSR